MPVRLLAIALLVPLSGCVRPFWPGSERVGFPRDGSDLDPRTRRGDEVATDRGGLSRRTVTGKEAPTTLLSADGMRCQVTERRFREVTEGEQAWCAWRKG